jgi:hypothetical protein
MSTDDFDGRIDDADESDLSRLERRLGDWSPSLGGLDRDRLLFEAGRADSAARDRRLVKALLTFSIATALAAFGLGTAWRLEHDRGDRLTAELALARLEAIPPLAAPYRPTPPLAVSSEAPDPSSYLALSRRIANGRIDFDRPDRPTTTAGGKPSHPRPDPLRVGDRDRLLDL